MKNVGKDTWKILHIVTSNRSYRTIFIFANTLPTDFTLTVSAVADMDASDTATVTAAVTGEASDVVDIVGGTATSTYFSGCLLA